MNAAHLLPSQIQARRKSLKLTQDELSAGSGVDRAVISRLERGLKAYRPDLEKLAAFYGISVDQLVEESRTPFTGDLPTPVGEVQHVVA